MKKYYDKNIQEWICTPAQHKLVKRIRRMGVPELDTFSEDLNAEDRNDPTMQYTQTGKIACKAVIRRAQALKRAGVSRITYIKPDGPTTVFGVIWDVFKFIVIFEIIKSLFGSAVSKIKNIK